MSTTPLLISLESVRSHSLGRDSLNRSMREYGPSGGVSWKEKPTPADKLANSINAIFAEGRFQHVTESKLEEEVEKSQDNKTLVVSQQQPESNHDIDMQDEAEKLTTNDMSVAVTGSESESKEMSFVEMQTLRAEMDAKLSATWSEINSISELLHSLIPSPPPFPTQQFPYIPFEGSIPLSSLSISHVSQPNAYLVRSITDMKMAIARGRQGLIDGRKALISAGNDMRRGGEEEKVYWETVKEIARGRGRERESGKENTIDTCEGGKKAWALVPRWLQDGTPAEYQLSKEVMIPYAPDQAAPVLRSRAIAYLNLNPSTSNPSSTSSSSRLIFPNRRHRRLRVSLRSAFSADKTSSSSCSSEAGQQIRQMRTVSISSIKQQSGGDGHNELSEELGDAQEEVFEEEIFVQVLKEAREKNAWHAQVNMDRVILVPVTGQELRFEMVNPEQTDEEEIDGLLPNKPARANLILSILQLQFLKIYQRRSANLLKPLSAHKPHIKPDRSMRKAAALPTTLVNPSLDAEESILKTLMPYLKYQAFLEQLMRILNGFGKEVKRLGLGWRVERDDGKEAGGIDWMALLNHDSNREGVREGTSKGENGGVIKVLLEERQVLSIMLSQSCTLNLVFPHTTLACQDMAQLPTYIAHEIRKQVLTNIQGILESLNGRAGREDEKKIGKVVIDNDGGVIVTKRMKLKLTLDPVEPKFSARAFGIVGKDTSKRVVERDYLSDESLVEWIERMMLHLA